MVVRRPEVVSLIELAAGKLGVGESAGIALQRAAGVRSSMLSDDFETAVAELEGDPLLVFSLAWEYLESFAGADLVEFCEDSDIDICEWMGRCARLLRWT